MKEEVKAKTPVHDVLGRPIAVGDYVAAAAMLGKSAHLHVGQVTSITEARKISIRLIDGGGTSSVSSGGLLIVDAGTVFAMSEKLIKWSVLSR